jgi:prenyltransferase beta subunit
MLQVARLAPKLLGESGPLVERFFRSQLNAEGGFCDRGGRSDLYYTVFGIEGLLALQAEIPLDRIEPFLRSFGDGEGLDLVHLACLARCWAGFPPPRRNALPGSALLSRVERYRSADGGYGVQVDGDEGSLYGCFMAFGAYQDAGATMPAPQRMLQCVAHLRTADGGYTNQANMPHGLTPSAAAAIVLRRHFDEPPDPALGGWLLGRCRREGGFFASPMAPVPDLLSTATALHALAALDVDFEELVEPCLDFLDSLWTNRGGFYGTWDDDTLDCEYTYYGLLALGHLAR